MGFIIKNTAGLINTRLTDIGREKLSQGNFNISYFQIGDSEVSYNTLPTSYNQFDTVILEPSFNAQNSSGVPQSNKSNVKYPYYVDGVTGNTYGIPFMDSQISPVYNRAVMRGFFTGNTSADTISWSALTNNSYAINANYVVQMSSLDGTDTITLISSLSNPDSVREPAVGDIITIYYDGNGLTNCYCVNLPTPTPTPTISLSSDGSTPTPTPTAIPTPKPTTAAKSTYFSTTKSTINLQKFTVTRSSSTLSIKVGKTLQARVATVGTRSLWAKVQVKDPSRKSFQIYAGLVLKNKSFSTPIIKFAKKGTYVVTISLGTTKKVITVKVA
jgi:hypothetical protein